MIPAAKPEIGAEERAAVERVMLSGMLAQGPEVAAFEDEFSAFVDGAHSVAVNSGTSALHMAFVAAGIGPGDEVIVPSFSFAATANSVGLAGATPVFVDIELDHLNLAPAASIDKCSADVPEFTAMQCRPSTSAENSFSNAATSAPCASIPESMTRSTAALSSSPMRGLAAGIMSSPSQSRCLCLLGGTDEKLSGRSRCYRPAL